MMPLLSLTRFLKSPTATALSSCNSYGTISLSGLLPTVASLKVRLPVRPRRRLRRQVRPQKARLMHLLRPRVRQRRPHQLLRPRLLSDLAVSFSIDAHLRLRWCPWLCGLSCLWMEMVVSELGSWRSFEKAMQYASTQAADFQTNGHDLLDPRFFCFSVDSLCH